MVIKDGKPVVWLFLYIRYLAEGNVPVRMTGEDVLATDQLTVQQQLLLS